MNKDIILQSNLLDIIFDNRNKDYGAYVLRKEYNTRMRLAIFGMITISIIFCFILLSFNSGTSLVKLHVVEIPPNVTSSYELKPKAAPENASKIIHHAKASSIQFPPKIEKNNINKIPATPEIAPASLTGSDSQIDIPSEFKSSGDAIGGGLRATGLTSNSEKPAVIDNPDVMPQYPGGLKALLEFLKRNIHSPEDVEGTEDVAVKIKFVVNYNGRLDGFSVIQSGGAVFDDEVLRVLKKMPLWIPGKSNGQNVSVHYIVPVTFTKEF